MTDRIPVILDTDIGSDIDDALCLAYLLRQPRCELVGVTTVSGQARERAMLVDAMCRVAGRPDVPIHSGCERPLLVPQRQTTAAQAEVLPRYPHRVDFAPSTAVDFLRHTIRRRPGEITLLSIGPLTNVGLLFAVDPEIPSLLKSLVMMCGVFTRNCGRDDAPPHEWNALVDPHATAIAYQASVAQSLSIGLDVTLHCRMDKEQCRQELRGGVLDLAAEMAAVWFRQTGQIVFHDPLAGAVIFEPGLCRYAEGEVDVDLTSPKFAGMTVWSPWSANKRHRIAVGVDADAFLKHYFRIVRG
jgi:inosine-uridine nucleoside N-ribohydrolase